METIWFYLIFDSTVLEAIYVCSFDGTLLLKRWNGYKMSYITICMDFGTIKNVLPLSTILSKSITDSLLFLSFQIDYLVVF